MSEPIYRGASLSLKGGDNHHQAAQAYHLVDSAGSPLGVTALDLEDLGAQARLMGWTNVGDAQGVLFATTSLGQRCNAYFGPERKVHMAISSKHTRPVAVGYGTTQQEAFIKMFLGDVNSPFGGFFGFNHPLEPETAALMNGMMFEGVVAAGYEDGADELLASTDKGRDKRNKASHAKRFLLTSAGVTLDDVLGRFGGKPEFVGAGVLKIQDYDPLFDPRLETSVATGDDPSVYSLGRGVMDDLFLAGNSAMHFNSNLVFFWRDGALVGLGDGCGMRYGAAMKARSMMEISPYAAWTRGTDDAWERALFGTGFTREQFEAVIDPEARLLAFSDAFFPEVDGFVETAGIDRVNEAFAAGDIRVLTKRRNPKRVLLHKINYDPRYPEGLIPAAVIQPGGAMKDHQSLQLAEMFKVPMIFTMSRADLERYRAGDKVSGRRFFTHKTY